jgi:hypothetical protein
MAREYHCFYPELGAEFLPVPLPKVRESGADGRRLRTLLCLNAERAMQRKERRSASFTDPHGATNSHAPSVVIRL